MESDAGPSEHSFHGLILIYIIKEADSFAYAVFPLYTCRLPGFPFCKPRDGGAEYNHNDSIAVFPDSFLRDGAFIVLNRKVFNKRKSICFGLSISGREVLFLWYM